MAVVTFDSEAWRASEDPHGFIVALVEEAERTYRKAMTELVYPAGWSAEAKAETATWIALYKPAEQREIAAHLPPGLNTSAFAEWMTERRRRKLTRWTVATLKRQFVWLGSRTLTDQRAIVEQSIKNGWQGLFDVRKGGGGESPLERIRKQTGFDW
jgi:hypothetical protein